jgi:hypothetical protein
MTRNTVNGINPNGVKPALKPLFFGPSGEWFEDIIEQFYMTTGGMGKITTMTPHGVIFAWVNNGSQCDNFPDRTVNFDDLIQDDSSVKTLPDYTKNEKQTVALEKNKPVTWKEHIHGDSLYIYEFVPFAEQPITSPEELRSELTEIMEHTPEFESLFNGTKQIAEKNSRGY